MKLTKQIFKLLTLVLLLIVITVASYAQGKTYTVSDVPNVHLQDRNAYVSDPEQKLKIQYLEQINQQLRFFEDSLDIQCAVIVLPQIDTEAMEFAHDLFNKWGVGNKETDRGLVFLLVYGSGEGTQRDIYIATGYGLEDELPDAICKHIQVEKMIPLLKEERLGEALVSGLDYTHQLLINEDLRADILNRKNEDEEELDLESRIMLIVIYVIGLFFLISRGKKRVKHFNADHSNPYRAYIEPNYDSLGIGCLGVLVFPIAIVYWIVMARKKRHFRQQRLKCEKCGSYKMKKPTSKMVRKSNRMTKGLKMYSFVCENCKHVHKEYIEIEVVSSGSSSSSGSSYSSSSSSGGSWGGGSSGGGGAGTSW